MTAATPFSDDGLTRELTDEEVDAMVAEIMATETAHTPSEKISDATPAREFKLGGPHPAPSWPPTRFPVANIAELPAVDDALERLRELVRGLKTHGDVTLVFAEWCALNAHLNLEGKRAPAFRPQLPYIEKRMSEAILPARVVIEVHWLAVTKQAPAVVDSGARAMFDDCCAGNFDSAWEFGKRRLPKAQRISALCLDTAQHQCVILRGDEAGRQLDALSEGKGNAIAPEADFLTRAERWCSGHRNRSADGLRPIWRARQLLGKEATWAAVAQLAAYMTGTSRLSRTTLLDREANIRRIAECPTTSTPKAASWLSNIPPQRSSRDGI